MVQRPATSTSATPPRRSARSAQSGEVGAAVADDVVAEALPQRPGDVVAPRSAPGPAHGPDGRGQRRGAERGGRRLDHARREPLPARVADGDRRAVGARQHERHAVGGEGDDAHAPARPCAARRPCGGSAVPERKSPPGGTGAARCTVAEWNWRHDEVRAGSAPTALAEAPAVLAHARPVVTRAHADVQRRVRRLGDAAEAAGERRDDPRRPLPDEERDAVLLDPGQHGGRLPTRPRPARRPPRGAARAPAGRPAAATTSTSALASGGSRSSAGATLTTWRMASTGMATVRPSCSTTTSSRGSASAGQPQRAAHVDHVEQPAVHLHEPEHARPHPGMGPAA